MADNDPYGLFGDDDEPPRAKKRPRTLARDVEQPAAETMVEDADPADPYGLFGSDDKPATAPDADLKHGPPPGPAGQPALRAGNQREHAWYEPLLEGVQSFAQGGALNLGDEAAGAMRWGLGKAGLMRDVGSLEENMGVMKADADRVTRENPYAHGAGQAVTGMAAGLAAGPSVSGQAAMQGLLSGASEYADSRGVGHSLGATTLGGLAGAGGAALGKGAARLFATSPQAAQSAELEAIKRASSSRPPAPPAQWPPGHPGIAPEVTPRPLPAGPRAPMPEPPPPKGPEYYAGQLDLTPPPRTPSAPTVEATYEPPGGDWTSDLTAPPRAPSIPEASERELQQIALRRAQNEMQPTKLGRGMRAGSTLAALGGHPALAAGMRGASALMQPGARASAIESGYLVPNAAAGLRTRMGSEIAWELGAPAAYGGKVNAQDGEQVAYATGPTLNYALSATLHAGRTGLSAKDEQDLTSAVVAGDDKKIAAIDFRLKQKYPAYARQVERALRDLNEGDD